ncbi:delta(14)-sterol reductase-like [Acanthaster planci]|uniref:Delta(14)-sterol reductase n=1 Tax=Acanthaster planci TaxID=133434 RepID=A0A8B7XL24_ACAPL|nr:delta(14)-sterol reductase-like [Acanthaster planci]
MPSRKYGVGEQVMVKWPGSALWYPAKVLAIQGEEYRVKFEEGTEDEVTEDYVKPVSSFRRRSQSKSPSRRRSRSRSPARSPSRQRVSRSPSRKSVAQTSSVSKQRQQQQRQQQKTSSKTITTTVVTQSKSQPKPDLTPTRTPTRTLITSRSSTEVHTYTTRSSTKSGQQTLEPLVEFKTGRVPKTTSYEFGGPIGTLFIMLTLPPFIYYLYFTCSKDICRLQLLPAFSYDWRDYYDREAYLLFLGWIALQAFFYMLPVGSVVKGLPLRNGRRLEYRLNGFFALILSLIIFGGLVYKKYPVTVVCDKFLPLLTAALIFSLLLSVYLYLKARKAPGHALAPSGNSGNVVYDFFMGHELNPRIGRFDFKFFCELRPGLIGWVLMDLAFVVKVWTDFPQNPPWPLLLLTFFQLLYVADSLVYEHAILSTMDIIHDGFGFMLVFGDLVWVPFTYTLQARYLADNSGSIMPDYCLVLTFILGIAGYYVFRSSNSQKNAFRENPFAIQFANSSVLITGSGKRLLTSGWWGWLRHPNYLGDLMMALSWSLCCGFGSIVPYFYPIYMLILLIHRERRDSAHCRQKYGTVWAKYCEMVPYRIFPRIY